MTNVGHGASAHLLQAYEYVCKKYGETKEVLGLTVGTSRAVFRGRKDHINIYWHPVLRPKARGIPENNVRKIPMSM